ncbi:hypothetical protein JCM16814_17520 [Desulfobaculum senezii]
MRRAIMAHSSEVTTMTIRSEAMPMAATLHIQYHHTRAGSSRAACGFGLLEITGKRTQRITRRIPGFHPSLKGRTFFAPHIAAQ